MVLKETLIENEYVCYYDSSNILKSEYNPQTKKMKLFFVKGGVYEYENVIPYIYQRFKHSKSQGVALKTHLTTNNAVFNRLISLNLTQISEIKEYIKNIVNETKNI
jgi:hypothetical protein